MSIQNSHMTLLGEDYINQHLDITQIIKDGEIIKEGVFPKWVPTHIVNDQRQFVSFSKSAYEDGYYKQFN